MLQHIIDHKWTDSQMYLIHRGLLEGRTATSFPTFQKELGIETYPVNWPIGCGKDFKGVYDRNSRKIIHFTSNGGAKAATATEVELGDPNLEIGRAHV